MPEILNRASRVSRENGNLYPYLFPLLHGDGVWIPRSSRRMTNTEFLDRLHIFSLIRKIHFSFTSAPLTAFFREIIAITIYMPYNNSLHFHRGGGMENPIKITYSFKFSDGANRIFNILLDRQTLAFISEKKSDAPFWAKLNHNKCSNCSLDEHSNKDCPIALNLADITEEFKDFFAYENVSVTVTTEDRTYSKDTTIQQGLSALIGIIMTTSGCPVMERLKPMVRFHLPFASLTETIFRMVSMYLMAQYFLNQEGRAADWKLTGLENIYAEVGQVNRDFAQRLADAAKKDANVNALVNLDCFATMVPLAAEETLNEIKSYFSAHLK